jgi:dipeptide/tripeptide permease
VSQLSTSINQNIVNDLKWLQEELEQKLNYSFEIYIVPEIAIDENKPVQKDLLLSDNNQIKIVAKIGTIAIAVTAGAMLITSTAIALATGAITGIVAEKLISSNIAKDKEKVRNELKMIISKTILEYSSTFSQNLRNKYDQINENLKTHSLKWQQTQLQALNAVEQRDRYGNEIDFSDILQKINTLSEEIQK